MICNFRSILYLFSIRSITICVPEIRQSGQSRLHNYFEKKNKKYEKIILTLNE